MRKLLLSILLTAPGLLHAAPFLKETIAEGFHDPMSIAPAPDGDIYLVEREGRLLRIRPSTGGVFEIGNLTVSALRATDPKSDTAVEDGLQGIALDPDFAKNQRIYLYYSHPTRLLDRLSRFTLDGGKLDLTSELVLIDVPSERHDRVCHHGGSVQFGPDGLLYLSIGDNTNPFDSEGYSPIDNREDREPWDAQRSAGNTNDLRGKILRIRPTETGYEIPPGNLFPEGTPNTLPEIYIMGCRNPFRISIDPKTNALYWGEVGPDANDASEKGPAGYDEVNQAKKAGNFGWPFVIADNKPYPILDFETRKPIAMTDPAAPENPGVRNTGLRVLPPAQPALIWYPYSDSAEFPEMGRSGRNAMAGPVFYHNPQRKYNILPKSDDHTLLTYDWVRGKIWKAKLGKNENLLSLKTWADLSQHPMDLEMADDGALWLLDYGSEWWFNKNGSLIRLLPEDTPPMPQVTIAAMDSNPNTFRVISSKDSEDRPLEFTWWLTTGVTEKLIGKGESVTLPTESGSELRVVASNGKGPNGIARHSLVKAAALPELKLTLKPDPSSVGFGEELMFQVTASGNPTPGQVTVRARYIPPTGHDAGGPQFSQQANDLVTANFCLACHQVDVASVGPTYLDVALKYRNQPDALAHLKQKLKSGGAGTWGEVPMPPQAAVKDEDAQKILTAILGLAEGMSETKGTANGTIRLAPTPAAVQQGGAWEFSAEAAGYVAAKFRIPAK